MDTKQKTEEDKGHIELMADIAMLRHEASQYEFHDYMNTKYAAPKMSLVQRLDEMRLKAVNGNYDN